MSDERDTLRAVARAAEDAIASAKPTSDWRGDYVIPKHHHDRLWDALVAWKKATATDGGDTSKDEP